MLIVVFEVAVCVSRPVFTDPAWGSCSFPRRYKLAWKEHSVVKEFRYILLWKDDGSTVNIDAKLIYLTHLNSGLVLLSPLISLQECAGHNWLRFKSPFHSSLFVCYHLLQRMLTLLLAVKWFTLRVALHSPWKRECVHFTRRHLAVLYTDWCGLQMKGNTVPGCVATE